MQTKAYGSFFAGNEPKFVIVREFGDCCDNQSCVI